VIIQNILNRLEPVLTQIELNSNQISQHQSNANMANTAAALSYLFTNNSRNSNVRTIGQIATIGGLVYANSQNNQAENITGNNIILISQIINEVERDGINNIRKESDLNNVRRFIELNLKTGKHLDPIVLRYLKVIKSKGRLGNKNINLLINANNIDIINYKIRLNKIYMSLEPKKQLPNIEGEFINNTSQLSIEKIAKEGMYCRIIIFSLIILGFVAIQKYEFGIWIILSGFLFWGINHYFPFFSETKRLKAAIDNFTDKIKLTCGINTINYS
jgi:hypothetical protein